MTNGVLQKSVTAGDHVSVAQNGMAAGAWFFNVPVFGPATGTDLTPYWSRLRDEQLRRSIHLESMWASAINKAITKIAARGWDIKDTDESTLRTKRGQQLLLNAENNQGWVNFVARHLRDFLTTDNGAFVEVVRASPAAGSKILGLMHLDSLRCTRTSDPERPVIYRDRMGREHVMRDYQVLMFVDMPSPEETYNGVGFCATSRAYRTIYKLAAMEQYLYEKASGSGATGLVFIQGVSPTQFETAMKSAENEQVAKGAYYYRGEVVIPTLGDTPINKIEIPLKSLPDGFDLEAERKNAYLIYANAIGVPVQDIQPLSGQGLGTGTQTVILAEAEDGQGLAAWSKQWEHHTNEDVLPETTTFAWSERDLRDQQAQAGISLTRAQARAAQIMSGEITAGVALQMAVDIGDVPKAFLPEDLTPGDALGDDEKPDPDGGAIGADPAALVDPNAPPEEPAPAVATKERQPFADVADLLMTPEEEAEVLALAALVTDGIAHQEASNA